jgi:hypothetical protein
MIGIGTPSSHKRIERPIEFFPSRFVRPIVVVTGAVAQAATFNNGRPYSAHRARKWPASVRLGKSLETIKFHADDTCAAYLESGTIGLTMALRFARHERTASTYLQANLGAD